MAEAKITLILDDDTAIRGLLNVEKQGKKSSKETEESFTKAFSKIGASIVAAAAAYASFRTGIAFTKEAVAAAAKQEDAVNRLNQSLINAGSFTQQASQDMQNFASELQNTTTVGDETTLEMLGLAKAMGATNDQAKDLVKAATNLSAATGITLESAVKNLGKTFGGLTGELGESVPQLRKLSREALMAGDAIKLINERFGGAAASQVNTYSGAVAQLSNIYGDFTETIGQSITQSPVVIALVKEISNQFLIASNYIKEFNQQGDFIGGIIKNLVSIGIVLNNSVIPVFEILIGVIEAAGDLLAAFISSIVQLVSGNFKAALEPLKEGFRDAVTDIQSMDTTKAIDNFLNNLQESIANAKPRLNDLGNQIKTEVEAGVQGITFDAFAEEFAKTANKMQVTAQSLARALNQTIGAGVANAFVAFGAALAKGENALEAFGKVVLGVFADILIQLGTQTLAVGIGMSAVPILFGFEGPAAIAAGIGMLVAGGALKALAGGGGGGGGVAAAPATGAGGVAASTAAGVSPLTGQPDVQEQGTNVQVVVQGNILNNKESALYIAEVLNESFRSNGTVVATG